MLSLTALEAPFTKVENFLAFKDTDGEKAPGLDGFPFRFVKSF